MPTIISETTGVTLGFAIAVIGGIISLVWQYARTVSKISQLEAEIKDVANMVHAVAKEQDRIKSENSHLLDRMARMETKIDFIIEALKEHKNI